jgi:hypothetical protein
MSKLQHINLWFMTIWQGTITANSVQTTANMENHHHSLRKCQLIFFGQLIDVLYWVQDTQQNKSIERRLNWRNPVL